MEVPFFLSAELTIARQSPTGKNFPTHIRALYKDKRLCAKVTRAARVSRRMSRPRTSNLFIVEYTSESTRYAYCTRGAWSLNLRA